MAEKASWDYLTVDGLLKIAAESSQIRDPSTSRPTIILPEPKIGEGGHRVCSASVDRFVNLIIADKGM